MVEVVITCRGCDKRLFKGSVFYFGEQGPFCRDCESEVRAMHDHANRPKSSGFGSWLKRFFFALLLAACTTASAQPVSVAPLPKRMPKPTDAMTFWGGYMWRQTMVQGVPRLGGSGYSMQRGDFWGGRLVGGLGFGRIGFEMRWDIAGLKNQFDVNNPSTFKTLEAYAGVYANVWGNGKIQIGPIVVGGSITSLDQNDYLAKEWTGAGLNLGGGGVRLAGFGSEAHFLCLATKNFLYEDPKVRGALVVHVRVTPQLYIVGDAISGADGFVRGGIAVRAF